MASKNTNHALIAIIPVFAMPLAIILGKQDQPNFLLGLSSDFWAGTLIGVALGAGILAIALMVRSRQQA